MIGLHLQPASSAGVGYWLGPQGRGRGLLHRSLHLVLDHAVSTDGLNLDRVEWLQEDPRQPVSPWPATSTLSDLLPEAPTVA